VVAEVFGKSVAQRRAADVEGNATFTQKPPDPAGGRMFLMKHDEDRGGQGNRTGESHSTKTAGKMA